MRVRFLVVLLLCALAAGGCVAPPIPASAPPTHAAGKGIPSITIVYPAFDDGVPAGSIEVKVEVRNFTLINSSGKENTPETGHIIYYRDVVPPTREGMPALIQGASVATAETSYTWMNVEPGTHTFAVQLVHDDDTPLQPVVLDAIDLTAYPP